MIALVVLGIALVLFAVWAFFNLRVKRTPALVVEAPTPTVGDRLAIALLLGLMSGGRR